MKVRVMSFQASHGRREDLPEITTKLLVTAEETV